VVTILACLVVAQSANNNVNVGFPTNGDFTGSSFDNVQLGNGNLHLEIPIYTNKGRGLSTSYKWVYDNKGWEFRNHCNKNACTDVVSPELGSTMVWALVGPLSYALNSKTVQQSCNNQQVLTYTNYVLREPDGTKHHFVPDPAVPGGNSCWGALGTVYADDGSGWIVSVGSNGTGNYATAKDGTVVNLSYNPNNQWTGPGLLVEDTNGNQLIRNGSTGVATDTLGRTINSDGSYYDSSGTQQNITITYQNVAVQTALCGYSTADFCNEYSATWRMPHIFTLPNGMTYTFTYDQGSPTHPYYGEPLSVALPTGATITWTYSGPQDESGRFVVARQVSTDPQPWHYNVVSGKYPPGQTSTGSVTDPAGNVMTFTNSYYLSPYNHSTTPIGTAYITQKQYYQGAAVPANLIKTVQTDYSTATAGAILPIHETVVHPLKLDSRGHV
jgi:hypothetical protein